MDLNKEQYQYIWFTMYELLSQNKPVHEIFYQVSEQLSPYVELNMEQINAHNTSEQQIIEVNPFYQFTHIFQEILDVNLEIDPIFQAEIVNQLLHILAYLGLQEGLNKQVILNRIYISLFLLGEHGSIVKETFTLFTRAEQMLLAQAYYDAHTCIGEFESFKKVIKKIYHDSIIYDHFEDQEKLVIYINAKKTKANKQRLKCIEQLFLPLGLKTKCFWEKHFGIIGNEATMVIGEMVVF